MSLYLNDHVFSFKIPLNPITHGLAFHQHLSRNADPPYNEEHFNQIRDAISERAIVLSNAAEDNGLAAVCFYFYFRYFYGSTQVKLANVDIILHHRNLSCIIGEPRSLKAVEI